MYNGGNAYSSIDQLQTWFFECGCPFWSIYHGVDETNMQKLRHQRFAENSVNRDLDESWAQLMRNIENASGGGGSFTIRVDKNHNFKSASWSRLILNNFSRGVQTHAIAGPAGIPSGYVSKEEVQKMLDIQRMERKIEDLESEVEAARNERPLDRLINALCEPESIQAMMPHVSGILGRFFPKVSVQGIEPSRSATAPQSAPSEHAVSEQEAQMIFNRTVTQVEAVFPDVLDFMAKLGNWIEANPEMAKTLFAQMGNEE